MNNAGMNIHVQVSVWTYVFIFPGCILRSGIAGSYGNYNQTLEELPGSFSKGLHHFAFPPAGHEGPNCSMPPSTIVVVHLFSWSHPSSGDVAPHHGFNWHFPDG